MGSYIGLFFIGSFGLELGFEAGDLFTPTDQGFRGKGRVVCVLLRELVSAA